MADDPTADDIARTARALGTLADDFSRSLTNGLAAAVVEGKALEEVLSRVMLRLSDKVLDLALAPVESALGTLANGLLTGLIGGITTVESGRTAMPPASKADDGGTGARDQATGRNGATTVVVNVTARDADSFRRSEAQVSAMLARAVGRGRRGL